MKMKKIFAAMAATAISAASFAAMAIPSASAADVVGVGVLGGQMSDLNGTTITQWNASDAATNGSTVANIDGNAQYEATWKITGDEVTVIDFLILEITSDTENDFTAHTYPDLSLTIDEVYIDGSEVSFTQNDAAINLTYYENNGRSRAYLTDEWKINGEGNNFGVPSATSIKSEVKVVFTVNGLYNEGTSNVTPNEPVTEPPTDPPTDPVTTTTTTAANGGDTTTTTAKDGDTTTTTTAKGNGNGGTTTTAKNGGSNGTTTTAKAASNGGKSETSAATGDAGVGVAAAALVLAGTAALAVRKRK